MILPNIEDVKARLEASKPPAIDIHEAVKQLFQRMPLEQLWAVALDQHSIKQGNRLFGKRSAQRVLQARHNMVKKGRKPYWPKGWVLAPDYLASTGAAE